MYFPVFFDRHEAGQQLAEKLVQYKNNALVFALPRGGVVVGFEIARALRVSLDVLVVRKLGVPWEKELGIGAIAEEGSVFLDMKAIERLGITAKDLQVVQASEKKEVMRRVRVYRQGKKLQSLRHRAVILVDDGVATGVTMFAAIAALKKKKPKVLIVAVPVCSVETAKQMRKEVDAFICLEEVFDMQSIGMYYQNFEQVEDEEVIRLLAENKLQNSHQLFGHLVAM